MAWENRIMKWTVLLGCAACVFAWGSCPANAANTTIVHVFNFDFSTNPAGGPIVDPTIHLGDTIEWTWDAESGAHPHSATSVAGLVESWDSGVHTPAFTYNHTFTHLGTFNYYCTLHGFDNGNGTASGMSGFVTVVPEPASIVLLAAGLSPLLLIAVIRRRLRFGL
jgi:plastocyanin